MTTWYQVWYLDNGVAKVFGFSIKNNTASTPDKRILFGQESIRQWLNSLNSRVVTKIADVNS